MEEKYMKKILSLGVAAAVLSLTAVAASAAIAPVVSDTATAGGTIVVEVVANGVENPYATFTVETSENLTYVADSAVVNPAALFNPANMTCAFASATAPADGTVLLTLTFDVAAAADEEVYVSLKAVEGDVDPTAVTLTVVDATDTDVTDESFETEVTDESFEEPTEDTEEEPTIVTDESTESTENGGENGNGETNPPTGIALAVVPALVAGAAVVASKKRK